MRAFIAVAALIASASSCAAPAITTTSPPPQSAAAEAQAARADDRAAGVLELQAAMESSQPVCGIQSEPTQICWSTPHATGEAGWDLRLAAENRQAAEEHRRVSTELRDAEALACVGVSEQDMTVSPFAHRDDIVDVQLITGPSGVVVGARVRFHELEKLSVEWLQHVVDCHLARDSALGHVVPELSYCPLVPRGASATVYPLPHGYLIEVRSSDPAGAREIARRAMALRP
jgi:hypothetical protein